MLVPRGPAPGNLDPQQRPLKSSRSLPLGRSSETESCDSKWPCTRMRPGLSWSTRARRSNSPSRAPRRWPSSRACTGSGRRDQEMTSPRTSFGALAVCATRVWRHGAHNAKNMNIVGELRTMVMPKSYMATCQKCVKGVRSHPARIARIPCTVTSQGLGRRHPRSDRQWLFSKDALALRISARGVQ